MLILSFAEPWRELIRADFAYQTLIWQHVLLLLATAAWLGWKCRQLRLLVPLIAFSGISHYFFLGITAILLTALMRYIDLIGEYVGGAILFMVLAAFLLSAAKYCKQHQERLALEKDLLSGGTAVLMVTGNGSVALQNVESGNDN